MKCARFSTHYSVQSNRTRSILAKAIHFYTAFINTFVKMSQNPLLYPLVVNTKRKLTEKEEAIKNALEDPVVQHFFADAEQKGWKDFEDIRLTCYPKNKNVKIKDIDINESGSNKDTASATLNRSSIEEICPSKDYIHLWYHTHNITSSIPSDLDQRAGQDIYAGDLGETVCAVGIDGISCLVQDGDDPLLIGGKWNEKFFEDFVKEKNVSFKDLPYYDDKGNIQRAKVVAFDQVTCYMGFDGHAHCYGKDFSSDGQLDVDLGNDITSVQINGTSDMYLQGNGNAFGLFTPFDGKLNCVKYDTNEIGVKLSCH